MSYLAACVSPETLWFFAFFGLAYPYILLANLCFVIVWIIFRKWYFLISLLIIIAGYKPLGSYIQPGRGNDPQNSVQETFKLLTYNVRLFNYYEWDDDTAARDEIIAYINYEKPDIVCFQEFITVPGGEFDGTRLRQQLRYLPYVHINYESTVSGNLSFGMATFSRYPIVNKGSIDFAGTLNGSIYSDINLNNDTIRIYNCHLQSVKLRKNYDDLLDSLIFNYDEKQLVEIKDISVRMKQAFIQRADQVDILSGHISSSAYPALICGDFNDTPLSYTYHTMSKGMNDAFIEAGSGFGITYRGFPHMRIDYILYSDEFRALDFSVKKENWSDHYPVVSRFTLSQTADSTDQHSPPSE